MFHCVVPIIFTTLLILSAGPKLGLFNRIVNRITFSADMLLAKYLFLVCESGLAECWSTCLMVKCGVVSFRAVEMKPAESLIQET